MAGRERRGAEPCGRLQQVVELDLLVAGDAGDRRLALEIAVGERAHHRLGEARLVVEHVMRDLQRVGHAARILDVLAGAAGALAADRLAMVVELERDADDVVAFGLQQRRDHRGVDAAGHGDDHARIGRAAVEMKAVKHWGLRRSH